MFDNLGKRIQSFFLVLIITLLIVVMGVFGFGNPTDGCNRDDAGYAAIVYGTTITSGDFNAAYTAAGFAERPPAAARAQRLREYMLEGLIERELLVHEAERLGFTIDGEEVMRRTARDEVVLLTGPVDAPASFPSGRLQYSFRDRDGDFSADYLRRFIQYRLRRSVDEFVEWQSRETLAQMVRDTVTAPVTVSPREIWDAYVGETERATISYVRFNPADYRDQVEITDAALTEWMNAHQDEVDAEYRRQRHRYTNLEEQARARHILIRAAEDASETDRAAARAEAQALLARVQAGEDIATLAREHSDDEGTAARGGDLGWRPRGGVGMVQAVSDAVFSHEEPGVHGEVVESQHGFHVIEVIGRRSGDVPEAEAKRELAEGLYREARAGELAREQADRALAYLRDGHSTDELNERLRHDWREAPAPAEGEAPAQLEENPRAPQVSQTSFGRSERALRGAFDSTPLNTAAFEMSLDEPLPEEPLHLGDNWVVFRLDERTEATEEGLTDETRARLRERLLSQKREEVLSAYVGALRARAESEGEIRENPEILLYGDETPETDEQAPEEQASL